LNSAFNGQNMTAGMLGGLKWRLASDLSQGSSLKTGSKRQRYALPSVNRPPARRLRPVALRRAP
jgi:hypothetical protein